MTEPSRLIAALLAASMLAACAQTGIAGPTPRPAAETIAVSVGPCFGFCPVYKMWVAPGGAVAFDGERHTAVLGARSRDAGAAAYEGVAAALRPYRPNTGAAAETKCEQRISDQQTYEIRWSGPAGTTTLSHDKGCRSPSNDRLNAVLASIPGRLGIDA